MAPVAPQLYLDAITELGAIESDDLVGATLQYVRDRIVAIHG